MTNDQPRMSDAALDVMGQAGVQALELGHRQLDTCHLLLALAGPKGGKAADQLRLWGVTETAARHEVVELLGQGTPPAADAHPTDKGVTATKRLARVLEQAAREAAALAADEIEPEHLLLAVLSDLPPDDDGGAGPSLGALFKRQEVVEGTLDAATRCGFCGQPKETRRHLVAGPGVFICDECVAAAHGVERGEPTRGLVKAEHPKARCQFCGGRAKGSRIVVAAGPAHICSSCLQLCDDILEAEENPDEGFVARARRKRRERDDLVRCSFCGMSQRQVKKLIAGPGVYICDRCVDLAEGAAAAVGGVGTVSKVDDPHTAVKCSFCGKSQRQVDALVAGPGVYICIECIDLCNDIIEEEMKS